MELKKNPNTAPTGTTADHDDEKSLWILQSAVTPLLSANAVSSRRERLWMVAIVCSRRILLHDVSFGRPSGANLFARAVGQFGPPSVLLVDRGYANETLLRTAADWHVRVSFASARRSQSSEAVEQLLTYFGCPSGHSQGIAKSWPNGQTRTGCRNYTPYNH